MEKYEFKKYPSYLLILPSYFIIMAYGPEDIARELIDRMLVSAGRAVQDAKAVNLYAKQGVAIRELSS